MRSEYVCLLWATSLVFLSACSSNNNASPGSSSGGGNTGGASAASGAVQGALCAPCTNAAECTGGTCLHNDYSGETFCGRDCDASAPCPGGYACVMVNGYDKQQCAPKTGSCEIGSNTSGGDGGGQGGEPGDTPGCGQGADKYTDGPKDAGCAAEFLGPFCVNDKIIGFDPGPTPDHPTLDDVWSFSLKAVNYLRSRTCLPSLTFDEGLSAIAAQALEANDTLGIHGFFQENCMNAEHQFGDACTCDWSQENYGAASGSDWTWRDGIMVPLCGMMTEPKGVGHRSNIESTEWKRMGVGVTWDAHGANWYHEFGR